LAKVTRNMIKSIVKECLVEIMTEGLGQDASLVESLQTKPRPKIRRKSRSVTQEETRSVKNRNFDNTIKERVGVLTNDSVLSSILADTARTTLQEQIAGETPGNAAPQDLISGDATVSQSAVDSLIDDNADRWNHLAFDGQ